MTKPVQIINNYWLKETILNGNPDLDKFYKEDLIRMINILKDENQKYKEVIDKAKKLHNEFASKNSLLVFENNNLIDFMNNLISVLKEVEHEKSNN